MNRIIQTTAVVALTIMLCACSGGSPDTTPAASEPTQTAVSTPTQTPPTTVDAEEPKPAAILSVEEAEDILRKHFNSDEPLEHLSEYDKLVDGVKLYCFAFPGDVAEVDFVNSVTGEITQEPVSWLDAMQEHWAQGQESSGNLPNESASAQMLSTE